MAKQECLIVLSSSDLGVSAPSFLQCYKLTQSAFSIQIAAPEAKAPTFIDKDDQSSRWLNDIASKNLLNPKPLTEIEEPVCAIGLGVCALLSAVKGDSQQWAFRDIALTGSSLSEVTATSYFASLPLIPGDAILDRAGIFSTGAPASVHIVVNAGVVTGQNPQSTLSAVQNMILLANQRQTKGK
ncbi:glutamine amidotransferase-like class 1 domain-containing protein 1 isoform X2 [Macrobrachium nipponense]|uniref:glutamine amidotransferase-like class 1 domain-containing protein 1 isoform X2 n=1 Tax=Macrobrachium nipponense TaxID=159736 RepID=UPI0030C8B330